VTVLENVPTAGFVAVHSGSNGEIVAVCVHNCIFCQLFLMHVWKMFQGVTGGEALNHISPNMVIQVSLCFGSANWKSKMQTDIVLQAGNEMRKLDGVVVDANVPQVNVSAANVLQSFNRVP
jgi:hypothetical protein